MSDAPSGAKSRRITITIYDEVSTQAALSLAAYALTEGERAGHPALGVWDKSLGVSGHAKRSGSGWSISVSPKANP